MILYFADRHLNILGQASTRLPSGITVVDDLKTSDIETGVSIFECDILFDRKTRANVEKWAEVGNYILRSSGDENEFYNIIDAEIDTKKQSVHIYAEDDGLDLLNEVAAPFEADQYYPISSYIERFTAGSGWEIGINEVEGLTRKLKLDDEKTVSARLLDIAKEFNNAEISFSFIIDGLTIVKRLINIYEERGKDTGIQFRLNKEIDRIITTKSIANLATALQCTGGTPDNSEEPVTLKGLTYDDGDFYVEGSVLKSRKAFEKWSRLLHSAQSGGHITKQFSFDTTSRDILCEKAIEELKKICDAEINYEVDFSKFPDNVKVGDRVNIIDDNGNLYVSSRILTLETSDCEETHRAVLGEHIIKESGISQTVADLAKQFTELANKRNFFTWIAYADDIYGNGISLEPTGKEYLGIAVNKKVNVVDISNPSVFTWSKIKGEPGAPGKDAEDANSIVKLCPEYYLSNSSTAQTGGSWSEDLPEWESGKYIWERQRVEWSDGSISYSDPVLCSALNHANEAAEYATQQAQTATEKAAQAEEHANNANEAAAEAQTQAEQSKAAVDKANEDIQEIKGDIETAEKEIEEVVKGLNTVTQTMEADYSKKTELIEIETSLKSEISRNATEVLSTVSQTYSLKTDTEEAQKNAEAAKTKADAAQSSANTALAEAEAAKNAADVADKAARDAQAVASAAENDLEEAKAELAAVTGRVDATEEEIAAAQTAVQQAQTKADEAKADAARAENAATEAHTNASNAIVAAGEAQTKADQALADLEDIQDRVTTAETNITQNSEKIEQKASKTDIKDAVDNIKIGGRNLLKFTSDLPIDYMLESGIGSWSWQGLTKTADGLRMDADNAVDSNSFQVPLTHSGAVQNNEVVTLSFEYRGNLTKFGSFYFAQANGTTALLKPDWTLEASETEWKRFEKTFSMSNANFATCTSVLLFYGNKPTYGNGTWIEIKNKSLQLEKGNKATEWTPAPEDVEDSIVESSNEARQEIVEQTATMTTAAEGIILEALKSYTKTSDYDSFKETVEAQLELLSNQLSLKFTETIEQLENVNGNLQSQLNTITAHFLFEIDGFTIGRSDSPYKIVISHDKQTTYANNVKVQVIDAATGEVLTPKLTVTERLNLFGYVIGPDSSGIVNCEYIGNYTTTDKEDDVNSESGTTNEGGDD